MPKQRQGAPTRRVFPREAGSIGTVSARMPSALCDKLAQAAAANGHSMSRELEVRLERSFGQEDITKAVREEFARYRAENETRLPNMRAEDVEDWLRH